MTTSISLGSSQSNLPFWKRLRFIEAVQGYLFVLPAVLGFLIFSFGPLIVSLYLSFTNYDIVSRPEWIGLANYVKLTQDEHYAKTIKVTFSYVLMAIPLSVVAAYLIALIMNVGVRGISIYRTLWYLPALVPAVATGALWGWMLNKEFGPINYPLKLIGLSGPGWLVDPRWVVPSLVLIHLWGIGNAVLIFLAGLQQVPNHLYEAAEVDGATWWDKFRNITIPMTSSIIFFNLIMSIIGSFQVFSIVYIIFRGDQGSAGPANSALVYVVYLYRNAFRYFQNGYASAMAWVLFLAIMLLTYLAFRSQKAWVYYESDRDEG